MTHSHLGNGSIRWNEVGKKKLNPHLNLMPTFGCFLSRLLVWLTRTLQTEIKISARHGAAAAASHLQPELGILSSIFHVFLPLIDFFVPVCLPLSLFIQTAHSGGNWKVPFSPVWLTRTARRIPAVSAASLLFCARVCITSALTRKCIFTCAALRLGLGSVDVKRLVWPTLMQLLL